MKTFNIGDTVYRARTGQDHVWITCPECLGSGRLRVIMGDDSEVSIYCVCCQYGYEGSPGKVQTYEFGGHVEGGTITGVNSHMQDDELTLSYSFNGFGEDLKNLFATQDEARGRVAALLFEHAAEEIKRLKYKEKQHKTWASNVAYYRSTIRRAKEEIARYEARLAVAPKNRKDQKEADSGKDNTSL